MKLTVFGVKLQVYPALNSVFVPNFLPKHKMDALVQYLMDEGFFQTEKVKVFPK